MAKMIKIIDIVVLAGIFLFVAFVAGFCVGKRGAVQKVEASVKEEAEIIIPTIVEKHQLSREEVQAKLSALDAFTGCTKEYQVSKSVEATRYFFEPVTIPFNCSGVVEVDYSMDEVLINIDKNTIYVTLPKAQVTDNHIIWERVECDDLDLVLKSEQYPGLIEEIKADGLAQVESAGIYDVANANLKVLIENFLQAYEDYQVEFVSESI